MQTKQAILALITALLLLSACVFGQDTTSTKQADKQKGSKMHSSESKGKDIAVLETSMGTIEVSLFRDEAPKTVENFLGLAKKGYYNGIIFHRVIDNFMIQGGDPTGTGSGGESIYGKTFADEISPNRKFDHAGILAMANAGPNTNGSQFFITLVPTPWLNGFHTIFGEVVGGMDVVKAVGKVKTSKPGDKPVTPVVMKKVHAKGMAEEKPAKEKK